MHGKEFVSMAVFNEDLRAFFIKTPVVKRWLFYSVLDHKNHNAAAEGGLDFS